MSEFHETETNGKGFLILGVEVGFERVCVGVDVKLCILEYNFRFAKRDYVGI